jgi:hypothetical protein
MEPPLPPIKLPVTAEGLRRFAMLLWRRAPSRPTQAARMLTLRRAQCFAGLARALDETRTSAWPTAQTGLAIAETVRAQFAMPFRTLFTFPQPDAPIRFRLGGSESVTAMLVSVTSSHSAKLPMWER